MWKYGVEDYYYKVIIGNIVSFLVFFSPLDLSIWARGKSACHVRIKTQVCIPKTHVNQSSSASIYDPSTHAVRGEETTESPQAHRPASLANPAEKQSRDTVQNKVYGKD